MKGWSFWLCRERQEGGGEAGGWRGVRFPDPRLETGGRFRDRARHARGELGPRSRRHHNVGEREKRDGRDPFGGGEARALWNRRPWARGGEDVQRARAAGVQARHQGRERRGAALFRIPVEEIRHLLEHGQVGEEMVRLETWQLPLLLQDWRG